MTDALRQVEHAIRAYRFAYASEDALQAGVAAALFHAGFSPRREVTIAKGCRPDVLVDRVAVEVKTSGSAGEVARQLRRYLDTGKIDGIVLVTTRVSHLRLQRAIADKRLAVIALPGADL